MKKIKYLHWFIIGLIVLYTFNYIGSIYVDFFTDFTEVTLGDFDYSQFLFGRYTSYVAMFLSLFTFIGFIFIKKGLQQIIQNGIFNGKSSEHILNAGRFFTVSGILGFIFNIAISIHSSGDRGNMDSIIMRLDSLIVNFLLIILAFVFFIIADIIKNGNELKTENDLTI